MRVVLSSVALLGVLRGLFAVGVAVLAVLVLPTVAAPAATIGVWYDVPAWSPDGTRIAWVSGPFIRGFDPAPHPPSQIWTANADGTDAAPLIGGLVGGATQIAWPRPQEILYDAGRVWLARPDGTHEVVLRSSDLIFSTDAKGTRVASLPDSLLGGPIAVVRTASGKRVRIRGFGKLNGDPTLSPDGRHIAFNNGRNGLFVARANGTQMHQIATHGGCALWSPRGNQIAFMTLDALRIVRPNGSHERVLVKGGGTCSAPPLMAWSPDGRQIAYVRAGVVLVNVASARKHRLSAFSWVTGFAWSPDSKRLLVTAQKGPKGCSALWTIDANGKNKSLIRNC